MNIIQSAYEKFCDERFPLPTESQIAELEKRINVVFPDDYRRFLLEFNGGMFNEPEIMPMSEGCPWSLLTYLCGINATHEVAELANDLDLSLFDDNDPPKILPIGDDPMGSLILLSVKPGEGYGQILFKEAYGDFYWLANGIEEFFTLLRPYVAQPPA